jgi:hypothetical protein
MLVKRYGNHGRLTCWYVHGVHIGEYQPCPVPEGHYDLGEVMYPPPDSRRWAPHPDLDLRHIVVDSYIQYAERVLPRLISHPGVILVGLGDPPRQPHYPGGSWVPDVDFVYHGDQKCRGSCLGDCYFGANALLIMTWLRRR